MDITNLTFDDESFDVIICSHVLEHVPEDKLAMQELFRVLKRGGWGLILVPIDKNKEKTIEDPKIKDPKTREELYGEEDHLRLYGLDFMQRLKDIGFNVNDNDFLNNLDNSILKLYGLDRNENMYVVYKNR
jgi:ubiquinone/menaquinone biosynthesis C-methylase UbiE